MYTLQQKLKYVKASLKKWSKESFENILIEKQRLESQIGEIQSKAMTKFYNEEDKTKEQGILKDLNLREKQEEMLWQQKSRQLWLKEGNKNSGFFHKYTIHNRQQNRITRLKTPSGNIV